MSLSELFETLCVRNNLYQDPKLHKDICFFTDKLSQLDFSSLCQKLEAKCQKQKR